MDSQSNIDKLLTPTKSKFEAKTVVKTDDKWDVPENRKNFMPASGMKESLERDDSADRMSGIAKRGNQ